MATTSNTKTNSSSKLPKREGKTCKLQEKRQKLVSLNGLKDALESQKCNVLMREVNSLDEFVAAYLGMIQTHYVPNSKMMLPWKVHVGDSYVCIQTNGCGFFSLVIFGTWESCCQAFKEDDANDE